MKRYVIIGNGVAGASAAEQIRKTDANGQIDIFSRENHPFYYRPRLPEFLAGDVPVEKFTMHSLDKYKEWNINVHLADNIEYIDPSQKIVRSSKQGLIEYDSLLLANGASCNIPPLPGADKLGVFVLRTIDDAKALQTAAQHYKQAVLVGGGLLGLEAGFGLIKLGLQVKVVEFFDRLLPRQMDEQGAKVLQGLLEKKGFVFHLGARVKEIVGKDQAEAMLLEDGACLPGGIILFSAGVHPNLELGKAIGLDIDKCIKVNASMQTSIEGIYAAGDVAEFQGIPGGIWPIALAQGKVAGSNMAGQEAAYIPKPPSMQLKVAGINLTSAGNIDPDNLLTGLRMRQGDNYRKIVLQDDVIAGFIFLGDSEGVRQCTDAMNQGRHLGELATEIGYPGFDFSQLD